MNSINKILLLLIFFSATASLFPQQDSIIYTMKRAESATPGCSENGSDTAVCIEGYITWPELTGSTGSSIEKLVLDKLRTDITLEAHRHFNKEGFGSSPDDVIASFIKDATAENQELDPDMSAMSMSYSRDIDIFYNKDGIFSFGVSESGYTGGAHPNYSAVIYNYSIQTGWLITPEDIFLPDMMDELLRLAEKQFRKAVEIPSKGNINDQGFWFNGGKFHLGKSFIPSRSGLTFLYTPYEVAPYAAGEISFFLSNTSLKKYISPYGPLSQYAEKEQ